MSDVARDCVEMCLDEFREIVIEEEQSKKVCWADRVQVAQITKKAQEDSRWIKILEDRELRGGDGGRLEWKRSHKKRKAEEISLRSDEQKNSRPRTDAEAMDVQQTFSASFTTNSSGRN